MKSVIVTSSLPDIVFYWADEEFTAHLNKVFLKDEVINENYDASTVDLNVALQYFSPLVLSQRCMKRENCGYKSITLGNGMIIVIDQRDDYVYLVLNGDGQESEGFLRRKLRVFQCLIRFHFGPNTDLLKPESRASRKEMWESLSDILETYCFLCCQQQGFLVEANEMIQVNQRVNVMSIQLLESVIGKANKEGDPQAKHAMLLVNSKVLALYSHNNASKIQAPDIMMLTTLVCAKFPLPQQSIPLSVNRTPPPLAHNIIKFQDVHIKPREFRFEDTDQDNSRSQQPFGELRSTSLEIKSPNKTTTSLSDDMCYPVSSEQGSAVECHSNENLDQISKGHYSSDSVTSEKYYTPEEEDTKFLSDHTESSSFVKCKSTLWEETSNSSNSFVDTDNELFRRRIFLTPLPAVYVPHTVHCLQISPGTVLVIVSEVKRGELAKEMCGFISILSGLIEDRPETQDIPNIYEKMEQYMRKITEGLKGKATQVKERKDVELYVNAVRQKWEKVKSNDFYSHLQKKQRPLSSKLEGAMVDMLKSLLALFGTAYCADDTIKGPSISIHHAKALYRIQEMVQKELKDYKGFLSVKGERNVTMTTYSEEFPGLVHFIYIDRTGNRVIAPSINSEVSQIYNHRDPAHFIKQTIWDAWNYIQTFLIQGHMNVCVRYGDFLFTYILWFEDSSGNQRNVKETNAFTTPFPGSESPGIIGSSFYSELKRRCFPSMTREKICCHELFCMHMGVLPLSQATGHAHRLAAMMWEVSGGAMVMPLLA